MKLVSVQDISCYGQCSLTVALPVLSAMGIETAILPSAILSTHTANFKNFTVLDLTSEMPKIVSHWENEKIKFDGIYTGYIGDARQFDIILDMKEKILLDSGMLFVDPAMADHGAMYWGLGEEIIEGMRKICAVADYILPNITEACFLTGIPYQEKQTDEFIDELLVQLKKLGAKNVILTGIEKDENIGASFYDGKKKVTVLRKKELKSYHGTGDIFSSVIVAGIMNKKPIEDVLKNACDFIIDSIKKTIGDNTHNYGVKFEEVLAEGKYLD